MSGGRPKDRKEDELAPLVALVAGGDRAAFADLFGKLAPKVKAYLIRLGAEPAQADDLAQDVMLTLWRKASQFDPAKASVMTWAFVIARNRRIDSLRRESSTITYGQEPPEDEDPDPLADDHLAGKQGADKMRAAISGLTAEQQEVVRRSFFEDEPHSAIAEALGLPLGTVKSRLRLAFTKLRSRMEEYR